MNTKLTVFFDGQFWLGIFERIDEEMLETSKVVFGAEPKDYEIFSFILNNYYKLKFSSPITVLAMDFKKINPKRQHRLINKEINDKGIGTKAQQAIKLEQEARKTEKEKLSKEKREEQEKIKFQKHKDKRKEKKKGH